jgi:hypothetical protein
MNNDQKPTETTKHTLPQGAQPAASQTYETPEPKRRDTAAPEEAKRPPQHEPGFEAKQKAEADKAKPKGEDDHDKDHDKPRPRAHTARAKQHVKRAKVRKHK